MTISSGSKYDPSRDIADIAKLVRADIKAAVKSGALPAGLKVRVRIDRFSMGCSLDVVVVDGVDGCFNVEFWRDLKVRPNDSSQRPSRYTPAGKALLATLENMCRLYQFVDVDSMSDYYATNFYLGVKFDAEIESNSTQV